LQLVVAVVKFQKTPQGMAALLAVLQRVPRLLLPLLDKMRQMTRR
jgi:hypothetical protein